MSDLVCDEVTAHLGNETTLALIGNGAEEADEITSISGESSDVIPLVVSV